MSYPIARLSFFLVAFSITPGFASEPKPKVLIVGIDGCRPDAMKVAKTPNLDALVHAGTLFEGTDIREPDGMDQADTVSGPGWSNLLTGVWPDKHGVLDNAFKKPNYKQYPHMFVRLKEVRPDAVTASFSTWAPIEKNIVSGANISRDFSDSSKEYRRWDQEATAACAEYLRTADPDLVICYQGQVDEAGHAHGFHPTVAQYLTAIETVDENLGKLMAAIQARPHVTNEDWLTIVCTDHGGKGTGHGDGHAVPEIRTTFLIVSGSAATQGQSDAPTFQVDVVPTALSHLNAKLLHDWGLDGRPVGLVKTSP
jgi:predicted AlkP superfamily pyrophosphatase or phosphodiesterase